VVLVAHFMHFWVKLSQPRQAGAPGHGAQYPSGFLYSPGSQFTIGGGFIGLHLVGF